MALAEGVPRALAGSPTGQFTPDHSPRELRGHVAYK